MKLLIIGGVAGGAAAAARARRLDEQADIIMFEKGEHISFANCGLPYYTGGIIKERSKLLLHTPQSFMSKFNIDVRTNHYVEHLDRSRKEITVKNLKSGTTYAEPYDFLVLSPGAEPYFPPFKGDGLSCVHTVRTVSDSDAIKEKLDKKTVQKAVVIGAGYIGIEMAENMRGLGIDITVMELQDQIMPNFDKEMAIILQREMADQEVTFYLKEAVDEIEKKDSGVLVKTLSGKNVPADIVIIATGIKPDTSLAEDAGLATGKNGIITDRKMRTSNSSIFAVGDAVAVENPVTGKEWHCALAGPAAKQARVAVNTIFGIEDNYDGTIATSIVKVFSLTGAATGATESMLQTVNIPYEKVYTFPAQHAGYYPGASPIAMKLLYNPENGTVLGAQVIGKEGVDKRIDILATAVKHGLTVHDLATLELAYAPPYGSARDPINYLGTIAQNHVQGLSLLTHWDTLSGDEILLDVRTPPEFKKGSVHGAVNIPLKELRNRLCELSQKRPVAVFCATGIRSHNANRILLQNGFTSSNVSGGYQAYKNFQEVFKVS